MGAGCAPAPWGVARAVPEAGGVERCTDVHSGWHKRRERGRRTSDALAVECHVAVCTPGVVAQALRVASMREGLATEC